MLLGIFLVMIWPLSGLAQDTAVQATSTAAESTANPVAAEPVTDGDAAAVAIDVRPFPRQFTEKGTEFSIYQPQYDSWKKNKLDARFVMAVKTGTHTGSDGKAEDSLDYGVVSFSANTQIDKAARAVVLTQIEFSTVSFPTATDKQDQYLSLLKAILPKAGTLTISLEHLESALAIGAIQTTTESVDVKNTPPDIIFTTSPSILILVQGGAALHSTGHGDVERVMNTRSLLLKTKGDYYTYFASTWAKADSLDGPWSLEKRVSHNLKKAMNDAVEAKAVDTLEKPPEDLQKLLDNKTLPGIYVRTTPAELITTTGAPEFDSIPGTTLNYVTNTGADVFIDASADNAWYVLVSGRWFTAPGSTGPWTYVASDALPADFAKIPPDNPKSGALASIPGTPEARESLIANSIPQTATVSKSKASLDIQYDGSPKLMPIEGTEMQYVKNTSTPVIQVPAGSYYAVDKGVWFTSGALNGPWVAATSVPTVIYSIPTSSPLHYVTYVEVYGTNNDDIYVGYTPGYYGTVVSNDVVVYGTGWPCSPWIGAYWYGCPLTYGMGAYFGWNPWVGWTFGWGWGWHAGWFGPYSPWWGPWAGGLYRYGWWGGGAAAWNVYGHWGNNVVRGTAAAWANPWTGNYGRAARGGYYNTATGGRGYGRAGVNTNIYTGTTRAGAQGVHYNPTTGRVSGGERTVAANPYTHQAATQGRGTSVNTRTGQVTQHAGAAGAGPEGAAGAGGFRTGGPEGNAKGVGGFHYNADTGTLNHGGAVSVNGNVYAGHDGNVYSHGDSGWSQVGGAGRSSDFTHQVSGLDNDRFASQRGNDRVNGLGASDFQGARAGSNFDRGRAGGFNRGVGGFRGGFGGGFRGGGFRR